MGSQLVTFSTSGEKQTKIWTHITQVNGWFPSVYVSYMSQNFLLFYVSNLSVRNFRIFLLMYPGSLSDVGARCGGRCYVTCPVRGCGWGGGGDEVEGGGGLQSAVGRADSRDVQIRHRREREGTALFDTLGTFCPEQTCSWIRGRIGGALDTLGCYLGPRGPF